MSDKGYKVIESNGLASRRIYKPEPKFDPRYYKRIGKSRLWTRRKSQIHNQAPNACLNATETEIKLAIIGIMETHFEATAGIDREYCPIANEYVITGQRWVDNKAIDYKIPGDWVAELIVYCRDLVRTPKIGVSKDGIHDHVTLGMRTIQRG